MERRTAVIRKINQDFRKSLSGGRVVITVGVKSQGENIVHEILELVRNFDTFNEDNDFYGEADFGAITHSNQKYFWKIDYYNLQNRGLSEDAANPSLTNRVLTVLLASEY